MLNIPYGTQVQDGVRSVPIFENLSIDPNGNVFSTSCYDRYGISVLCAINCMYNIVPYTSQPGGVCGTQNVNAGPGALTLNNTGADSSCTRLQDQNGNYYIQLDWPRALSVTVSTADFAANTNLTVFGTDWYGVQMQESISLRTVAANPYKMSKAFYTITRVYLNGATAGGTQIAVKTQDVFGLPFVLNDKGAAVSFGWNNISYLTSANSADPGDPIASIENPNITAASTNAPGNTSGDVRGTVAVPDAADATKRLLFQYYLQGADTNQNIWNGMGFQAGIDASGNRVQIPALNQAGLYGLPQYYTGDPA
jgi:hypothetical protein